MKKNNPKETPPASTPHSADALPSHIEQTVYAINRLHGRHQRAAGVLQRIVEAVTAVVGTAPFAGVLVAVILSWIGLNLVMTIIGYKPFDPAPFNGLSAGAQTLALFLAVFILATQRREDVLIELRLQLMLELALLSEQRSAKAIALLEELRVDMPSVPNRSDPEADALAAPGNTDAMLEALLDDTAVDSGATDIDTEKGESRDV